MMDPDVGDGKSVAPHEVLLALATHVQLGTFTLVAHGYCFDCDTERIVVDVSTRLPAQPARCIDCWIKIVVTFARNADAMQTILDQLEDTA